MDLERRVVCQQNQPMPKDILSVAVILVAQFSLCERAEFEREANRALAAEGIRIQFYQLGETVPAREPVLVYDHPLRAGVLGQTHRSNGEWLGVIDIDLQQIRNSFRERWQRAYARVLAHEVWHWAKRNEWHNSCGLFAERVPHALLAADALLACAPPRPIRASGF